MCIVFPMILYTTRTVHKHTIQYNCRWLVVSQWFSLVTSFIQHIILSGFSLECILSFARHHMSHLFVLFLWKMDVPFIFMTRSIKVHTMAEEMAISSSIQLKYDQNKFHVNKQKGISDFDYRHFFRLYSDLVVTCQL